MCVREYVSENVYVCDTVEMERGREREVFAGVYYIY